MCGRLKCGFRVGLWHGCWLSKELLLLRQTALLQEGLSVRNDAFEIGKLQAVMDRAILDLSFIDKSGRRIAMPFSGGDEELAYDACSQSVLRWSAAGEGSVRDALALQPATSMRR